MRKYGIVAFIYMYIYAYISNVHIEQIVLSNYSALNNQIQPILLEIDKKMMSFIFVTLCIYILFDLVFSIISVDDFIKYDTKYKIHFGSFIRFSSSIAEFYDQFIGAGNGKKSFLLYCVTFGVLSPVFILILTYKGLIKRNPLIDSFSSFQL